eukprot:TRINITY_DN34177_c0_g1_i3.p1 TRINITY_DN34177_c0_g1~~TRINITY_DN34177_c0_g1_i3.p1  ORF type:complete len:798 (-),score=195.69 TRINITY_DN34177_c0_g1_i3:2074-4212(-)
MRKGQTITMVIMNMNAQGKLYSKDFRPVFRSERSGKDWERVRHRCTHSSKNRNFQLRFRHSCEFENDVVSFAFVFPFPFAEYMKQADAWEEQFTSPSYTGNVYFYREKLIDTVDKRPVELLTITSKRDMSVNEEEEKYLDGLFPDRTKRRPPIFRNRKYVFLSARVHPGETPGSFVLDGCLQFILDEIDPRAERARECFVFKCIPMLNPDGVFHGHYRADTLGRNLNRCYIDPSPTLQPSIFAARSVVLQLSKRGTLQFYFDFHAHATKRGCFVYGNSLQGREHVLNVMLAKLISLNDHNFDYFGCSFSSKNMSSKDRADGKSKEGTGRVALFRATGLIHLYALECNYNMGRSVNRLPPLPPGLPTPERATSVSQVPKFTMSSFRSVGKSCILAMLDYYQVNPWSRLFRSAFGSLSGLYSRVWKTMKKDGVIGDDDTEPKSLPSLLDTTREEVGEEKSNGQSSFSTTSGDGERDGPTPMLLPVCSSEVGSLSVYERLAKDAEKRRQKRSELELEKLQRKKPQFTTSRKSRDASSSMRDKRKESRIPEQASGSKGTEEEETTTETKEKADLETQTETSTEIMNEMTCHDIDAIPLDSVQDGNGETNADDLDGLETLEILEDDVEVRSSPPTPASGRKKRHAQGIGRGGRGTLAATIGSMIKRLQFTEGKSSPSSPSSIKGHRRRGNNDRNKRKSGFRNPNRNINRNHERDDMP